MCHSKNRWALLVVTDFPAKQSWIPDSSCPLCFVGLFFFLYIDYISRVKESITGRDSVVREALEGKSAYICAVSFNASFVDSAYFMWSRNSFCIPCPSSVLSCNWDVCVSCSLLSLDSFLWFLGWMFVSQVWWLQRVWRMANSFSQQDFFYSIWWDDHNNVISPFQLCLVIYFQKLHSIASSRAEKGWFCSLKTDKPYLSHTQTDPFSH